MEETIMNKVFKKFVSVVVLIPHLRELNEKIFQKA